MPAFDAEQHNGQKTTSPPKQESNSNSKRRALMEENGQQSGTTKKPKIVDVHINGDSFDQITGGRKCCLACLFVYLVG